MFYSLVSRSFTAQTAGLPTYPGAAVAVVSSSGARSPVYRPQQGKAV